MATKTSNGKVETLSDKHARLIEQYGRTAGAAKAQIARQIGEVQVDLRIAGETYTAWEKPSSFTRSWELSESQLRDQITALRSLVSDDTVEPVTRSAAERRLERYEQQSLKRGLTVE